jgi:hypothetical protein
LQESVSFEALRRSWGSVAHLRLWLEYRRALLLLPGPAGPAAAPPPAAAAELAALLRAEPVHPRVSLDTFASKG